MKIVFFGTADFGIPTLDALVKAEHEVCAVVTNPPKRAGRGLTLRETAIDKHCQKEGIGPILCQDNLKDADFLKTLASYQADIFVVVAFSILPKELFSIPSHGTYNIHAALLPLFRGPAPIQRAIEAGATETGVTVFRIDVGVDTGNILLQKKLTIGEKETTPELYERLSLLGGVAITEAMNYILESDYKLTVQNHNDATRAPLLHKREAFVNWQESALEIERKIRAFKPFPGTYSICKKKRIGIEEATVYETKSSASPGTVISCADGEIHVACGSGILGITEVKPEGKRKMRVIDYLNGSAMTEGCLLG